MIYIYFMIFVTGGTGLIGAHLLYALAMKGEKVRSLRRKESNVEEVRKIFSYYSENADELFSKIEWVEGDLLDIFSLENKIPQDYREPTEHALRQLERFLQRHALAYLFKDGAEMSLLPLAARRTYNKLQRGALACALDF